MNRIEGDLLPLSCQQEQLWYLENLDPGTPTYTMGWRLVLRGPLDERALRGALDGLVARHETLRTTFTDTPEGPRQVVAGRARMPFTVTDLTGQEDAARKAAEIGREAAGTVFDLRRGPLVQADLVRLAPHEHLLITNFHHIVVDGWSIRTLSDDLATLYNALRAGRPPRLGTPARHRDYVRRQGDTLTGDRLAELAGHWRDRLDGAVAAELPPDRPRPAHPLHEGDHVGHRLSPAVSRQVRRLAAAEGCTPFMVLMAAFVAVLARHSGGRGDLTIGTATANRTDAAFEDTVGLLVNMLALRLDAGDDPTFRTLTHRVRAALLEGLLHQELPFGRVVEEVNPPREPGRPPLFQIAVNSAEDLDEPPALDGLEVTVAPGRTRAARFDLTVELTEDAVTAEYSTELYERATIELLLRRFETLLAGGLAVPGRRIGELPLLDDDELWRAVHGRNEHVRPCAAPYTLDRLFETRARERPAHVAVSDPRESLTYAELDRRADRLAGLLRAAGVRRGSLVGICLDRSVRIAEAVLAVLKAGGAYVPLDPAAPPGRLAMIVGDAQASVVVTESATGPLLATARARMIDLDTLGPPSGTPDRPDPGTGPEDLAYVIYTSGSTGRPKGTLVEHRNVTSLLNAAGPLFEPGDDDVWALFHSYAFDVSVWEMWGCWSHGARLAVVPQRVARSPEDLLDLLAAERVTVLCQTPTAFAGLDQADAAASGRDLALRYVIFAGERLGFSRLRGWFDRHGDKEPVLVNMYGPTETTVYVTHRVLTGADVHADGSYLGTTLPNSRAYVVDDRLRPVPPGAPGELLISGESVTRGYLRRPEATAELFIGDPMTGAGRCYRTGDVVRESAAGELEFLGRRDDQVKIRGFRVEPGEVASALRAHPDVRDAAVVAGPGERLHSYVVPADGRVPGREELREFLARTLPPYMIPASFAPIDGLPMNQNGKLDVRALPPPGAVRDLATAAAGPRTPRERELAAHWRETLGLAQVGIDDDYFVLGGHSIGAARLVAWIRERYDARVALGDFLAEPTIRATARLLRAEGGGARCRVVLGGGDGTAGLGGGTGGGLSLVHPAGGSVACYRELARELGPGVAVSAYQSPMLEGGEVLDDVESTAERFLTEAGEDGALLGGWSFGGLVAYEMALRLSREGRWTGPLLLIDTPPPGEVSAGDEGLDDEGLLAEFDRYLARMAGEGGLELTDAERRARYDVFRTHLRAQSAYRPAAPLPGDIVLVHGTDLPDVDGWAAYTTGRVTTRRLPADHFALLRPPHAGAIARFLTPWLTGTAAGRTAADLAAVDRAAADRLAVDREVADRPAADLRAADLEAADLEAADRSAGGAPWTPR